MTEQTMCDGQLDLLGETLKADGMARAEQSTDDWWRDTCDRAIDQAAREGRVFQAFDLCERYGLPEPRHPSQWGPRFSAAAKRGVITSTGAGPSTRPTVGRSLVRLWKGNSHAAA